MNTSSAHLAYTHAGLQILVPTVLLPALRCVCGCRWHAHNTHPRGTTAYDRYCLKCSCLGFVPVLGALMPEEGTL